MKVLIVGGAGYIGSTIASILIDQGHFPIILDNFHTGRKEFVLDRNYYSGNMADENVINKIFSEHPDIEIAILAAALICVPESVANPLIYFNNNVNYALKLVKQLISHKCNKLIFSSSASIYAPSLTFEVTESSPIDPQSPYARSKSMFETILADICGATDFKVVSLRYFNPIGTDPKYRSGLQIPLPSHLLGQLIVAWKKNQPFVLTGTDWPTRDGSGIRDYVHVWDLAIAHLITLEKFNSLTANLNYIPINLGTGTGTTVVEFLDIFQKTINQSLKIKKSAPRPGDVAGVYANNNKARELLNWKPELNIQQGIINTLEWFNKREKILGIKL